jgi:hypothetical protein
MRGTCILTKLIRPRIEVPTKTERAMAICEYVNCKGTYKPVKSWQRFCSTKCHDDWHYHQKKLAQLAVAEAEAEERRQARLEGVNGDAPHKPLSELLQAFPKPEPTSFKRKDW